MNTAKNSFICTVCSTPYLVATEMGTSVDRDLLIAGCQCAPQQQLEVKRGYAYEVVGGNYLEVVQPR